MRILLLLLIISLPMLACQVVSRGFERLSSPPEETLPTSSSHLPKEVTATPTVQTTTIELPATAQPTLPPSAGEPYPVSLHPDGDLYAGDWVSIEVHAPEDVEAEGLRAEVRLETNDGEQVENAKFQPYGIAGRYQATLYWVWDTSGLEPGNYPITYTIQPQGPSWSQTVTLLPAEDVPAPEPEAEWATSTSDCCLLHYITGTAAQRDIDRLVELSNDLAVSISDEFKADYKDKVSITLLPRVLGHGGFTAEDISVSYLDRNYAGSSPEIVLKHEMVHKLDGELGGELRPNLLLEGLAVYLSGGHFKPEPLMPRAAALYDLGRYLPLSELADNFYPSQHETGYLEAGALVEYMVDTWGWEAFSAFYRDIHPEPEVNSDTYATATAGEKWSQAEAIDAALQEHFRLSLTELEEDFIEVLKAEPVDEGLRQDVSLTLRQYDAVRHYQQLLDPSAYFMTAWLPDGKSMRKEGIVSDYLRHPAELPNLVLETMLVSADVSLRSGDYPQAQRHLDSIEKALSAVEAGKENPLAGDALVEDYKAVANQLLDAGYQPQRIVFNENTALAWGTPMDSAAGGAESGLYLEEFELARGSDGWFLPQKVN